MRFGLVELIKPQVCIPQVIFSSNGRNAQLSGSANEFYGVGVIVVHQQEELAER